MSFPGLRGRAWRRQMRQQKETLLVDRDGLTKDVFTRFYRGLRQFVSFQIERKTFLKSGKMLPKKFLDKCFLLWA
jgi:hypothetical protein